MNTKYNVDENGFYGQFGGAFIPEMLYPNVEELKENYLKIMAESSFQEEFNDLLQQFVGRLRHYILPNVYQKNTTPKST